jgi:hypothetical protein
MYKHHTHSQLQLTVAKLRNEENPKIAAFYTEQGPAQAVFRLVSCRRPFRRPVTCAFADFSPKEAWA